MHVKDAVSELGMDMEESQNQRDKRVEELWKKLDPQGAGELDFKGIQRGLRRIDHPMKNADDMLKTIVSLIDTSGDGKVQYEEFRVFIEAAEKQLFLLFHSIDRDHDGKLDKRELRAAFQRAGLAVPMRRLGAFFDEIDTNHDGYISFPEWRDFLLFMPAGSGDSPLEAALSFFSSIVTVGPEGDSTVSEETLEGLGTTGFLFKALFGILLKLASPDALPPPTTTSLSLSSATPATNSEEPNPQQPTPLSTDEVAPTPLPSLDDAPVEDAMATPGFVTRQVLESRGAVTQPTRVAVQGLMELEHEHEQPLDLHHVHEKARKTAAFELTQFLPETGYFLAGAISGAVSRTATAPLDRLKVYLLVNTKTHHGALAAAKSGHPLRAIHHFGKNFWGACTALYQTGGIRTFFVGNGLNVLKIMPESAIRFGSYEAAKRSLATYEGHGDPQKISIFSKFVAGGVGGMVAQLCVYPIDTLKFRLQSETVQGGLTGWKLLYRTAQNMRKEGTVRTAYRGLTMGLVGMFPYSAIDMGTFETLKNQYIRYKARANGLHEEDVQMGGIVTACIGAFSGAFGATVVYPLNVLRTRLQTQGTVMHPPTYTGIWDVAQKTLRNEGVQGLYKGLTPNLLKVAPALGITWVCYENSKRIMGLS